MNSTITVVPSGQGFESGPRMMVVLADDGMATADLYREHINHSARSCPAQRPIVALVRTTTQKSPDRVTITGSRRDDNTFIVDVEIRRYDGPLAGNDPWIALIRTELGSLSAGEYALVVQETRLRFTNLHDPDQASDPVTTSERLIFHCV